MAEKSILWTTGALGDGAAEYTMAEVFRWMRQTFINEDDEGVLKNYANELEGTGVASPVAIDTGAAYDHGIPYWNTVSVDVAVANPVINTRIDRIVLRAVWATQTVRITLIDAVGEGLPGPPDLVQIDGNTWDIPLWTVSITIGGVITLTDDREWVHPNIGVSTEMLDDDSVDDTVAGNRVPQLYRRQGGDANDWDVNGAVNRTPGMVRMQAGVVQITLGIGAAANQATVTFPVVFTRVPIVFTSLITGNLGDAMAAADDLTVADFEAFVRRTTTTAGVDYDIAWLAIGTE